MVTGQKIRIPTLEGYPRRVHSRPSRALSNGQDVGFPSQRWGFDSPRPLSSPRCSQRQRDLAPPRLPQPPAPPPPPPPPAAGPPPPVLDPRQLALELAPGGDPLRVELVPHRA